MIHSQKTQDFSDILNITTAIKNFKISLGDEFYLFKCIKFHSF